MKLFRKIPLILSLCIISLNGDEPTKISIAKQYQESDENEIRLYEDLILDCGSNGKANFTISLPEKIPAEGLPCIIIVGGLETGRKSLKFIPNHGQYALIAYEYPPALQALKKISVVKHIIFVRKAMNQVPNQLIDVIHYVREQPWINKEPISFMGYSFGSIFIPAIYYKAEEEGIPIGPGVLAYGGAGIYCLAEGCLPFPTFINKPIARYAAFLFKPMDPIWYASKIKSEFLIINGLYDKQIPSNCAHCLQQMIPSPKTIINLETGHINPKNPDLILRIINMSRSWLEEKRKEKYLLIID